MDHRIHVYTVNICVDYNNVPNILDTLVGSFLLYQGQHHVLFEDQVNDGLRVLNFHPRSEIIVDDKQ